MTNKTTAATLCALCGNAIFGFSFMFSRIALGAGLGLILGILLAFFAARVRAVEFLLQPLILTVRTVPVASFIILALMFNEVRSQKYKKFLQTVSYLPHFISFVVVYAILYNFFGYDGFFNGIRKLLGKD